ncbi:MAG TPA: hypothetical protein VJR70_01390, partial [Stellaceae bacterium]|nr:hypothetical protein [Stellaceae bacterium]
MQGEAAGGEPPRQPADGVLWRRSATIDTVPSETERFLDLAGYADGLLDPDERERVAAWLAQDAETAADVAAARALAAEAGRLPPV